VVAKPTGDRDIEAGVTVKKRILVLGGGFGGVHTARALERMLGRDPSVEVTLVSRDNFFLYTPMLHEIASCEIDITHIVAVPTSSSATSKRSI
jgi:NADH dehydrogenase FAD-containing subunit